MSDWTTDMIGELEDRIVALERKVDEQAAEIARLKFALVVTVEAYEKVWAKPYPGTQYSPPAYCGDHDDTQRP